MASSNKLIVEVVGDTKKLTQSLNTAQQQINKFANSSSRKGVNSRAAVGLLAEVRGLSAQADVLSQKSAEVDRQQSILQSRFAGTALKAGVAGFAVNALGRNFQELGGNAGKLGTALSSLSTGNLVGFVKGLQSINEADPAKIGSDLLKMGDAAQASSVANDAAAIGLDKVAAAARAASEQITAVNNAFVDNTKIRDSTSPGAIAAETSSIATPVPKKRPGVSQSQRNQFFDSDISRQLDRVQDVRTIKGQISALNEIAALIDKRRKATKDVTRRLTLEDQIVQIDRQKRSLNAQLDAEAKARADAIRKRAEKEAKALSDAADTIQRGLLSFAKKVKGRKGGPLTATTSLNANRVLQGLGLSTADEKQLRARLSQFNSAGKGIAGSGSGAFGKIVVTAPDVFLDGQKVSSSTRSHNTVHARRNPSQKRGRPF